MAIKGTSVKYRRNCKVSDSFGIAKLDEWNRRGKKYRILLQAKFWGQGIETLEMNFMAVKNPHVSEKLHLFRYFGTGESIVKKESKILKKTIETKNLKLQFFIQCIQCFILLIFSIFNGKFTEM